MLSTLGVYEEDMQSSVHNFGYMYCTYTYVVSTLGDKKQEPISNKKKGKCVSSCKIQCGKYRANTKMKDIWI